MEKKALIIYVCCILCLFVACKPFKVKVECSSLEEIGEQLDFPICLPDFVSRLPEQEFEIEYNIARAFNLNDQREIAAGYIIEICSKNPVSTGYASLEINGINIERSQDALGTTDFSLSSLTSGCHVQIQTEMAILVGDMEMMYSEYRAYSDEDIETQKKGLTPIASPDEIQFDTFYAYVVHEGNCYSILIQGLPIEDPDKLRTRCLSIAVEMFENLFN